MAKTIPHFEADLSGLSGSDWWTAFRETGEEYGTHKRLGNDHEAVLIPGNDRLIVTFEVDDRVQDQGPANEPRGWVHAREDGWTSLTVISRGETWFRDPALFAYFDALTDDGFFEDFEEVLFYGAGSGGYAAAAYSVAAPGARVVAVRPQATLSFDTAGWDPRYRGHRRVSFEDRYGYAPDMIDAASSAAIIYDPEEVEDAMHAALFRRANVTRLACPYLGWKIDTHLQAMQVLQPILRRAMDGNLDTLAFARLYRARRSFVPYLRGLLKQLQDADRPGLARRVCRHGVARTNRPLFRKRLEELDKALARTTAAE